ncbi:MarR family transcriptional regulator [Streptomonospora sp. S1-112]|uniref:MarR family transcriptional regulator n=1 Tax=Streptomonospora mangrovi TaxID=2883123 RepID=A0A9X3NNU2_9ACTN|nr:MarR family transcriptional regulator [Streptomonospora mangrovi]MDA0565578.1 MarR family transcriptional regulator [Streptomonospora mangrovi]
METAPASSAPERLKAVPTRLLGRLAVHSHRLSSEALAQAGVRSYHYALLAALAEFGPSSQAELGRRCGIDRSDVVAVLNDLQERGAIQRTPDPADRRRNSIVLTAAGRDLLRRLDAVVAEIQNRLLAPLNAEERTALVDLLVRLDEHHAPGGPADPA